MHNDALESLLKERMNECRMEERKKGDGGERRGERQRGREAGSFPDRFRALVKLECRTLG